MIDGYIQEYNVNKESINVDIFYERDFKKINSTVINDVMILY